MTNEKEFYTILSKDLNVLIGHPDDSFLEKALNILKNFTTDMGSINDNIENSLTQLQRIRGDINSGNSDYDNIRTHLRKQLRETIPKFIETDKKSNGISLYSTQLHLPKGLTPEVYVEDNMRDIAWLKKAIKCSKSVCRILVKDSDQNLLGYGTGFLVKGNYLFTCNHVLKNPEIAKYSTIEFNYEHDEYKKLKQNLVSYELDSSEFITDEFLDYTRVKVKSTSSQPLESFGYLETTKTKPTLKSKLSIIHHPEGNVKHISIFGNQVKNIGDNGLLNLDFEQTIQYDASTEGGSSGSPVFNNNWDVIGIHHGGVDKKEHWNIDKSFNSATLFSSIENDIAKKKA